MTDHDNAQRFQEWFEDNIKTETVTDQFFTTETEEEDN